MATNSLEALLAKLKNYPVTQGWGALAVFSRERVNRMLEQQFTAAFTASRFIAPCSGEAGSLRLTDIVFGAPVLSFETASLGSAVATLTIPLLAGSYREVDSVAGRSPNGISGAHLRADSGAILRMDIDLEQVASDSDNTGRIAIDLGKARNPICTLVDSPAQQRSVGEFLLEYLRAQPKHKTTYLLGVVDAGNYAPLNPVKFVIRTQPAPGSKELGAHNAGDGAVLVFMKLQGYDDEGSSPGADFPYLIPDDTSNGEPLYTASLFVIRWLSHFINDANLAVLKSSLLPAGSTFAESGRYTPNDTALFGNLASTQSNVRIEPPIADLELLQSLDFSARRGDGTPVANVSWTAGCLNSPLSPGQISSSGRYTATSYPFGVPPVRMTTVTARYTEGGQPAEASAFLLVRYDGFELEPLVSTRLPENAEFPVQLEATGQGAGAGLAWTLLQPKLGRVEALGDVGQARYTPPPSGGVPLVAQRIEASNQAAGVSGQVAVLLLAEPTGIPVEPPFVSAVSGQGDVSFEVPEQAVMRVLSAAGAAAAEDVLWRWSVVGEGSVVGDGRTARFTPPVTRSAQPLSVLVCEMIGPEVDYLCGYAVVQMAMAGGALDVPHWQELGNFDITAPDGVEAHANGMQQIRVQIRIETKSVNLDGNDVRIPISDVELASLKLVHRTTSAEVPFVDPLQDGIEHGDSLQWAASERRNRFNLYRPTVAGEEESVAPASEEGVRYRDLYLHLKTDESVEFYAQFQADDGRIMRSLEAGLDELESVTVKGVQPPAIGLADYEFHRERVWNGQGKIDGDDEFTYMLQSIDFWTLAFRKAGYDPAGFATLKIDGNTSSIQWESELLDETFFSCTGYAFSPKHRLQPVAPTQLSFDPYLGAMMTEVSHAAPDSSFHSQPPSPGELVVSLHRDWDVTYWYDGQADGNKAKLFRKALDGPVTYTLLDENGNRHNLQIGFRDRSLENSRNTLNLIVQ